MAATFVLLTQATSEYISQMVFSTGRDPQSLVEAMRVSSVQQVATTLAQELKDYRFGLEESFCEPRDLQLSLNMLPGIKIACPCTHFVSL